MTRKSHPPPPTAESDNEEEQQRTHTHATTKQFEHSTGRATTDLDSLILGSRVPSDVASLTLDELRASFQLLQAENSRLTEQNSVFQVQIMELTERIDDLEHELDIITKNKDHFKERCARLSSAAECGRGNVYSGKYVIGGSGYVHMGNNYSSSNTSSTSTNQTFQRRW